MGTFYRIHCKKCGYEKHVGFGTGFLFPEVYEKTVSAAKKGELGEALKKFFAQNPDGVIDVSNVIAVCPKCKNIEEVKDLSMYLPKKDVSQREKNLNRRWSVAMPFYEKSYVIPWELKEKYNLYEKYPHKCKKCGGDVKIFDEESIENFSGKCKCPRCNNKIEMQFAGMWD